MHEYPITLDVVRIAVSAAEKAGAAKVTSIHLIVGELSSVFDESVQLFFDILSEGTPAAGAKLVFKKVRAELKCISCGFVYERPQGAFDCPRCGGESRLTGKGKEFLVESIEVDGEKVCDGLNPVLTPK